MSNQQNLQLVVCGATDVGLSRDQNEDTFVIADLRSGEISSPCVRTDVSVSRSGMLLLVCDGMGGHAAGEVAAHLAAESMKRNLVGDGGAVDHPVESLRDAMFDATAPCGPRPRPIPPSAAWAPPARPRSSCPRAW
jgi:serine/threonine protein phosphatase PrpC